MKLRNRLWVTVSLLFAVLCLGLYLLVAQAYEKRMLLAKENISIAEALAVAQRLEGSYPRFPERTQSYLLAYSQRFDARLLIVSPEGMVLYDSYSRIPAQTKLDVAILNKSHKPPLSLFIKTGTYGYVQHTLLPLDEDKPEGDLLLMIEDVNMVYEDILSFRRWILLLVAGAIAAAFAVCYWLASWFTRPIHDMIRAMRSISQERRTFDFHYGRKDEMRELAEAIRSMVNQLNRYEERQRQFLSASSHELKTPLATMQLITENLPHARQDEGLHAEFVQDLAAQIERMKGMVERLLEANRLQDLKIKREPLTAEEIKSHIEEHFQPLARQKQLSLRYDLEPLTIHVDRQSFFLALDNLISNALRYSPPEKKVTVRLKKGDEKGCVLSICDEGIGIPEEELPYIFDPFFRSQRAVEKSREGSGLGLTLVKQVVDRHGGKIEVESSPDEGTCFHIVL